MSKTPEFTITYFPFYGRAEPIKMLLNHAGADFDEVEIQMSQWPKVKGQYESLPTVEFHSDGRMFNQA